MHTNLIKSFTAILLLTLISVGISFAGNYPLAANKKTVEAFYDEALNQKDFVAASKYLGSHYTQHNPLAADGAEGLKGYIDYLRSNYPNAHSEIKHIYADEDYVIVHVHSVLVPNTRGQAIVDIFKLENGKIVEHWDVIQAIPEKSANDNGMF